MTNSDTTSPEELDQAQSVVTAQETTTEGTVVEAAAGSTDLEERLVAEGEIAGDYLEELLDLLDFDGDIDLDVEGDRAVVSIDGGGDLTKLVGRKGEVLDALQELTRLAVYRETGERSRLMLDVSGYRAEKRERLVALAAEVIERVKAKNSGSCPKAWA